MKLMEDYKNSNLFNPFLYNTKYHNQDLSNLSFLITGGAGFIGSNIVEYLIKYGAGKIRVLDNLSNGYIENIQSFIDTGLVEFINGDIKDLDVCNRSVKDIDFVFHEAALGSVPRSIKDPLTSNEVNVSGFLNMLTAAKDSGSVRRFIYAASSSTYGDSKELPKREDKIGNPLSPYAVSKLVNELYATVFSNLYGLECIGLRYFNVFGPKQSPENPYASVIPLFVKSAKLNQSPVIFGDGETSRDFTFIENVVQANIKSIFKNIEKSIIVNVACGEQTSLNRLWMIIAKRFQCPDLMPKYSNERTGDVKHSLADLSNAMLLIDYNPKFSVQEGIDILYKSNY